MTGKICVKENFIILNIWKGVVQMVSRTKDRWWKVFGFRNYIDPVSLPMSCFLLYTVETINDYSLKLNALKNSAGFSYYLEPIVWHIQMGSVTDNGSGGVYAYRASKAALNQITKSLAIDLEPQGVTTVLLHPGQFSFQPLSIFLWLLAISLMEDAKFRF